jgi:hypothetical protein
VRFFRSFPRGVGLLAAVAACSSQDSATIQLTLGGESTTFTQTPAVTRIVIQSVDTSDNVTTLGSAPVSATTIPLASQSESTTVSLEAWGIDAQDAGVVFGATIPLLFGDIVGDSVPIFVGRIGQFARAPSPPADSRQAPLLSLVQGQYLFVAGGTAEDGGTVTETDAGPAFTPTSTTEIYDFGEFQTLASPPTMPTIDGGAPFAPQSVAVTGTVTWLVSPQGGIYLDLSSNATALITQPTLGGSFSFANIAAGITLSDAQGTQYIVGATRTTGAPTAALLEINPNDVTNTNFPDGNVAWLTLSEPRLGAAAAWINSGETGGQIVVAGGSASGSGVEVISPTAGSATAGAMGTPLPYPADPSTGSGAAAMTDNVHVLLAGGLLPNGQDAGVRVISATCTTACTPTWWTSLPIPLATAQAFVLSATSALVIGNEPGTGLTHAFLVTGPGSTTSTSDAAASDPAAVTDAMAVSDAVTTGDALAAADAVAATDAVATSSAPADDGALEDDAATAVVGPGTAVELLLPTNQDSDAAAGSLHNARAIQSPVGTIVVFGGYPVLDSFQPYP